MLNTTDGTCFCTFKHEIAGQAAKEYAMGMRAGAGSTAASSTAPPAGKTGKGYGKPKGPPIAAGLPVQRPGFDAWGNELAPKGGKKGDI